MNRLTKLLISPFTRIILLIIFYTMTFPVGLVTSFNFALSIHTGGEYILGNVFFDAAAAIVSGYAGVWLFTQLWNLRTALKDLNKR